MYNAHNYENLSGQLVNGGGPAKTYIIKETRINSSVKHRYSSWS